MQIRIGYELIYDCLQPTPMTLTLNIHFTRVSDLIVPDHLITGPSVPITAYRDGFGNWCSRLVAPKGQIRLAADAVVNDSGEPEVVAPWAGQTCRCKTCPRKPYCFSWAAATAKPIGYPRWLGGYLATGRSDGNTFRRSVVFHRHIAFGYEHARATKTAWEAFDVGTGVCRDFTHLAIAFCRCMNIPARSCTGYLGDIGIRPRMARWISPPGSRHTLTIIGTSLTLGTTRRASVGC